MQDIEITPHKLQSLLQNTPGLLLLDVRTEEERQLSYIPGSKLYDKKLKEESQFWTKETLIVCYCNHGIRSLAAAKLFKERGFTNSFSLQGGLENWTSLIGSILPKY